MNRFNHISLFTYTLLAGIFFFGCQDTDEARLERQLAKVERQDSIFLGYYFGMPSNDFYEHSRDLNLQQIVREGPKNQTVEYNIEGIEPELVMNFYPKFHDEKIYKMPVFFHYPAWGPWNKELWSDKLLPKVVELLEQWYGPGFEYIEDPQHGNHYKKIEGNRRITAGLHDNQHVKVVFTDLIAQLRIDRAQETEMEAHMKEAHQGEAEADHDH